MARRSNVLALALAAAPASTACGYRAVYGGAGGARLHVALVRSLVPDAVASDEVVAGVRERLAREGMLADGDGYPRIEVEVLRADEIAEGTLARDARENTTGGNASSSARPVARGLLRG